MTPEGATRQATRRRVLGAGAALAGAVGAGCVGLVGGPRLEGSASDAFEAYKRGKRAYDGAESDFEDGKEAWEKMVQEWQAKDWSSVSSALEAAETKYGRAATNFERAGSEDVPEAAAERASGAAEHAARKRDAMALYVDAVAAYAEEDGERGGKLRQQAVETLREAKEYPAPVPVEDFRDLLAG